MNLHQLRQEAKTLEPVLRIGKFGLTEGIHGEIEKLLKKRKLIKIKVLNNCPAEDIDEMIEKIQLRSKALLISRVGGIFSLYRD